LIGQLHNGTFAKRFLYLGNSAIKGVAAFFLIGGRFGHGSPPNYVETVKKRLK
jgi:hypothetical protein